MIENFHIRLKQALIYKGLNNKKLDELIGASNGYTGKILSGQIFPSIDKFEKMVKVLAEVDTDWLLSEEGKMLKKETKDGAGTLEANELSELQKKYIAQLEANIKYKELEIEKLQRIIASLDVK
jgi:hypothetical protein